MVEKLYSNALVELAKDTKYFSKPERWTHQSKVSSPLCGDELELYMEVQYDRCKQIAFEAEACIVCRASAVVMARSLEGATLQEGSAARESLEEVNQVGRSSGSYADFEVVHRFPSRQSCASLPWIALERALEESPRQEDSKLATQERMSAQLPRSAFEAIERWREQGQECALATLVAVEGSSPSPLGSRMVVCANGEFWGSVSGGCVESAVVRAGMDLLHEAGHPGYQLLEYTIANSQAGEVGLPCGGQIQVYLSKAPAPEHVEACRRATSLARLSLRIFSLDGETPVLCDAQDLPGELPPLLREALATPLRAPLLWRDQGGKGFFAEPLRRTPPLLIVGGTHIAQKLSLLAQELGFAPVIIEGRTQLAQRGRFPGAEVIEDSPARVLEELLADDCAVVMLTHNPRIDDPALKLALASQAYYVGALGSRKTQRARLERLASEGLSRDALDRIHGPVGLAIGAKGASEIALSILAQVVQSRRTRKSKAIGAVVLAAGASTRFGHSNKLLADLGGQLVIQRVVQRVLAAGVGPCVVVLGHDAQKLRAALEHFPVTFVENPEYAAGMASSVVCGIRHMAQQEVDAAFVLLGDMPEIRIEDYEALCAAYRSSTQHLIVAPSAVENGKRRLGNPVLWPRRYFEELTQLQGDRGAKSILLSAPGAVLEIDIEHAGVLQDIDTPEDLVRSEA